MSSILPTLRGFASSILSITALFISSPSMAETSLSDFSRAEMLEKIEEISEASWEPFSLLYTRLDQELKPLIPGKEWTDEDREVAACIFDKVVEDGKRDEYEEYLLGLKSIGKTIVSNPQVNVFTLADHPEVSAIPEIEGLLSHMTSCGQMSLMSKRMQESGLMTKLAQAAQDNY